MHSGVGYHCGQQGCLSAGPSGKLCRLLLGGSTRGTRELGYVYPNTHPALIKAVPGVGLGALTLWGLQPACSLTWLESTAAGLCARDLQGEPGQDKFQGIHYRKFVHPSGLAGSEHFSDLHMAGGAML